MTPRQRRHARDDSHDDAQAEGVELKDVVNLAFHEFFERRQYLPSETLGREP